MARKQLQNMQLPESGYNPIVFQGYTTEGPEYDTNILANSIGRLDEAIKEAHESYSAIDLALAEKGSKLNEAESKWFNDFKQNYKDQIQAEIDAGNFGNAINLGKRLGSEAVSDKGLNARIQYNADLQKYKDDILNNNKLSDNKKRWAIHKYAQYDYHDTLDNGKVIGGNTFDRAQSISDSFNPDQEWLIVNQLVAEESGGSGGTTFSDNNTKSTTSSTDYHRKLANKLVKGMETRFENNGQLRRQLDEELEADLYNLKQLQAEYDSLIKTNPEEAERVKARLDDEREKLSWNGSPITDYKKYYLKKIVNSGYPEIMQYNNIKSGSSTSIIGGNYGNDGAKGFYDVLDKALSGGYRKSGNVNMVIGKDATAVSATTAGENIVPLGKAF